MFYANPLDNISSYNARAMDLCSHPQAVPDVLNFSLKVAD